MVNGNTTDEARRYSLPARLLTEKRIPLWANYAFFALSLCFGGWYSMRGMLAQLVLYTDLPAGVSNFLCNEVTAFVLGGLMPFLVYFIVTRFTYRMMLAGGGRALGDQAYIFRIFYGAGYLVYGAFSMIYFAVPVLELYGEVIVRFIVMAAAVALYVLFECLHGLPKRGRAVALYAYGLVFSAIYLVYCVAELFMMIGG